MAEIQNDDVELRAKSHFFELANMTGRMLKPGDVFKTDRARAVELRANNLVSYTSDEAEAKAAPPPDEPAEAAITTRSLRRSK